MTSNVPIETRNEVARAVRSALVKHGYAYLRSAQIAEESNRSEGALFYHYGTKDAQLAAFLARAPAWIDERIEEIEASDPDERLRKIVDLLLSPEEDDTLHGTQIAILELLSHAPHEPMIIQEPLEDYQNHIRDILTDEIRAAVDQGIYRQNLDPEETASFLLMILDGSTASVSALELPGMKADVQAELDRYLNGLNQNNTISDTIKKV